MYTCLRHLLANTSFVYSSGVFIKVTHSGPRSYVQLVEAYRDDAGRPKQRTVATLGRLDQLNSEVAPQN